MGEKDEIRKRVEALARFRNALIELMNMTDFNADPWGDRPAATPKPGTGPQWQQAKALVDQLSTGAAKSFSLAGVFVEWKPRGTFDRYRVNPGAEWDTILTYDPKFTPDVLEACMNRAKGSLDEQLESARTFSLPSIRWSHLSPFFKWLVRIGTPALSAGLIYWLGWK